MTKIVRKIIYFSLTNEINLNMKKWRIFGITELIKYDLESGKIKTALRMCQEEHKYTILKYVESF